MNFTESIEGLRHRSERDRQIERDNFDRKDVVETSSDAKQQEKIVEVELGKKAAPENKLAQPLEIEVVEEKALIPELPSISSVFHFEGHAWSEIQSSEEYGSRPHIKIHFSLPEEFLPYIRLYIHWGSYDELPERWGNILVRADEITKEGDNRFIMDKALLATRKGNYGATVFAEFVGSDEKVWQGAPNIDDVRFQISQDSTKFVEKLNGARTHLSKFLMNTVSKRINNAKSLDQMLTDLEEIPSEINLSKVVYECTKNNSDIRHKLSNLYTQARKELREEEDPLKATRAAYAINVLENIGIGEVVLVAPEGPHAIAGGLAHVMIGLLQTLSQQGVHVTLIAPLYEYAQGHKHRSAVDLLRDGFKIGNEQMNLHWAGEVSIPFGPTYRPNSTNWKDPAYTERCAVYMAEAHNMKVVLLRHPRYASTLYSPNLGADEQLRRSIFLSRGALEVMKSPIFGIHAEYVLSNDWMAALVPCFMKLDLRYSCAEELKGVKTVHLIHNCGRDYHGRIPAQYNCADLWPMLELAPEHYQWMADPQDNRMLNLTSAAIMHLNGALLTVSRPYAEQLQTVEGGEGLTNVVATQKGKIYGISNAIDQAKFRNAVHSIGELCLAEQRGAKDPAAEAAKIRFMGEADFLSKLLQYKAAVKTHLQRNLGLEENPNKIVLTFMGRVAEQKGLSLFNGFAAGDSVTMLESLLIRYPNVQVIIAGPPVDGDTSAKNFRSLVDYLSWKYQRRVRGIFDFIQHSYAIELLTGTDFYLMPSRFEPGGITQLEALACGAVVIAHNVGGLSATLHGYGDYSDKSNSFLFNDYNPTAFRDTVFYALDELQEKSKLQAMMIQAAKSQHDWGHRMPQYLALLQHLSGVLNDESTEYSYLDKRLPVLKCISAD